MTRRKSTVLAGAFSLLAVLIAAAALAAAIALRPASALADPIAPEGGIATLVGKTPGTVVVRCTPREGVSDGAQDM